MVRARDLSPEERRKRQDEARARLHAEGRRAVGPDGKPYVWEQFKEGNIAAQTHGAGSERRAISRPSKAIVALGDELEAAVREHLGGVCPEQLTWPQFGPAVRSWARLEARTVLLSDWLDRLVEDGGVEAWATPQRNGAVKTPFELWMAAERASAKARKDLGLDPASWASIQRDLGIAERNQADALAQLGKQGERIRERRGLRALPAPDGG